MKFTIRQVLVITFTLLFSSNIYSQDLHLSQFDASPLFYNPALAGKIEEQGLGRIILNYKSQWRTYNTFLISYDQLIQGVDILGGKIGAGVMINTDYAGETSYGNTQLKIIPAFHKDLGKFWFSTGVDVILNFNNFSNGDVELRTDYGDTNPDYTLPESKNFFADLDWGFNVGTQIQQKYPINLGFTFNRILGTGGGIVEQNDNYRRYSINANTIFDIAENIALKPSFIFQDQKTFIEMNFGTFVRFNLESRTKAIRNAYIGGWCRWDDAFIAGVAFDFPGFTKNDAINLGISYDFTLGDFKDSNSWSPTGSGKDSFEISLKYIFKKNDFTFTPGGIINEPVM